MDKIIIYGTTQFSRMCHRLVERESAAEVIAYTIDDQYLKSYGDNPHIDGLPIVGFEYLEDFYPPSNYKILNTIGYTKMNKLREEKTKACVSKGYQIYSFISKDATVLSEIDNMGKGNIILPRAFVGCDVILGDNNVIYTACVLTHDINIRNNSFLAAGSTVGGNVSIGNNCFIGMNSTIKNRLKVADFSMIGAATYLSADTEQYSVYVPERSKKLDKISTDIW